MRRIILVASALWLGLSAAGLAAPRHQVVDLGSVTPMAMTRNGTMTGVIFVNPDQHAVLAKGPSFTDLARWADASPPRQDSMPATW
jgi:hypothetical protein